MEAHFSLLVIEALLESKLTNRLYHDFYHFSKQEILYVYFHAVFTFTKLYKRVQLIIIIIIIIIIIMLHLYSTSSL